MIPLIKKFDSDDLLNLKYSLSFNEKDQNLKTNYLCNCGSLFRDSTSICQKCNSVSGNFFILGDFIRKILYLEGRFDYLDFKNLTYTIFSDGISPFLKSKRALWPIFIVINELDYSKRFDIDNIILLGIYYGLIKPNLQIILKLIIEPYLQDGDFTFFKNGNQYFVNLTSIVADKPARSMLLNMQNFNAQYGCPFCIAETKTSIICGRKHIYVPYQDPSDLSLRSHAGVNACAFSAESSGIPDYGIKGYSFLSNLSSIDIVKSNCIDYMHSVCLGITKSIVNLLFNNKQISRLLRLGNIVSHFCESTDNFTPCSTISSPIKSIKNLGNWNAKDFRNFLFYLFPIGFDIFREAPFFKCIMSLRNGIFLLDSPNISNSTLANARSYLKFFRQQFSMIFGEHYATPNFHDLDHLVDSVSAYGPLHQLSGFNFEHVNGILKSLCKGNKRLDRQIYQKLDLFSENINSTENLRPETIDFLSNIENKSSWKPTYIINSLISICGIFKTAPNNIFLPVNSEQMYSAKRAMIGGLKISTKSYKRCKNFRFDKFMSKDYRYCIEIENIFFSKSTNSCFFISKKYFIKKIDVGIFKKDDLVGIEKGELVNLYKNYEQISSCDKYLMLSPFYEVL